MDGFKPYFTVRTCLSFLLLILLQTSTEAQLCSHPSDPVEFNENNAVDDHVTFIEVQPGVTVELLSEVSRELFSLHVINSTQVELRANEVLDAEDSNFLSIMIICTFAEGNKEDLPIFISVINVNDNPPVFAQNLYDVTVSEFSPNGTVVGSYAAEDLDRRTLTYSLTPESAGFRLAGVENPELVVDNQMLLNYDKVKNIELTLYVEDEPLVEGDITYNATTTIMVTIEDIDDRPPWFQPCNKFELPEGVVVCHSSGYTGSIVLNKKEEGALPLKPGPLYAIDGDSGINDNILYRILAGNDAGLFEIDPNTGNITMTREADVVEDINLVVMAFQESNMNQFATTTVTLSVNVRTENPPYFEKESYEAVVTSVGNMAMNATNKNEPLRIVARDDDYAAAGGINPDITYEVTGSSAFIIINSYLFMTEALPEGTLDLEVVATDKSSGESATAKLIVEVASGISTTRVPLSTSSSMATTPNTQGSVTTINPSQTGEASTPTTRPADPHTGPTSIRVPLGTTGSTDTTSKGDSTTKGKTDPSPTTKVPAGTAGSVTVSTTIVTTSEDSRSTTYSMNTGTQCSPCVLPTNPSPNTDGGPSGPYGVSDMVALGVTLGVLLLISLVIIVVLVFHIQKMKADWRKIYQTNLFRSSLGKSSGDQKEGIQYINGAFVNDEDKGNSNSSREVVSKMANEEPHKAVGSSESLQAILPDNTSLADSDKADSEKEIVPILTKERRNDEGYKSVWFKQDIDPDAKEEVVIIPDSDREQDSDEEDGEQPSSSREEDEDDNLRAKTPRVTFNDTDIDSGLGVKIADPAESDSDHEKLVNFDL